jgi:hypothetical protein
MTDLASLVRSRRAKLGRRVAKIRGNGAFPAFLVLGGQRCGTTSLFSHLSRHPAVGSPFRKEIRFFDSETYARGERFYRTFFPSPERMARRGERVTGEASPNYLFFPLAPERIARMLPEARFIVLLRDPVVRAWSHHAMQASRGREPLAFEDAIDSEEGRLAGEVERLLSDPTYVPTSYFRYSYLARGDYAPQLERWFGHVDRERIHVIVSEEFFSDRDRCRRSVEEFLGLRHWEGDDEPDERHAIGGEAAGMAPETRAELRAYFAPRIRRTEELLGRELPWGRQPQG